MLKTKQVISMKFQIHDFVFDSSRLIFYPSSCDERTVEEIESAIQPNDGQSALTSYVTGFDPDHMSTRCIFPYQGGICLTYKCQLRCNYCSFRSQEENALTLTEEDIRAYARFLMKNIAIRKLVSGAKKELHLFFSGGGEPTYHPALFRKAVLALEDECAKNDVVLKLDLTTNGMTTEKMIDFIADHFDSVMVSYDGMPALQNKNRRTAKNTDTAEKAESTIRAFCGRKERISTTVRTTLWHPDIPRMKEIAAYIYDSFPDLEGWSVMPILATGRAGDSAGHEIFDSNQYDFVSEYFETKEFIREKYNKTNISSPMLNNSCTGVFCGQLEPSAGWLMPGGKVITCLESKEFSSVIANVRNGHVEQPKEYKSQIVKMYQAKFEQCKGCIAYRFCKGGCPLKFLYKEESSADAAEWECETKRNYWRYIFRKLLSGNDFLGWTLERDSQIPGIPVYHLRKGVR